MSKPSRFSITLPKSSFTPSIPASLSLTPRGVISSSPSSILDVLEENDQDEHELEGVRSLTTIITRNKQTQKKRMHLESVSISQNSFLSIIKEHVWLEELSFKNVNLSQLDEKKMQSYGNALSQLQQLQMVSCKLNHVPTFVCEPASNNNNNNNNNNNMNNMNNNSSGNMPRSPRSSSSLSPSNNNNASSISSMNDYHHNHNHNNNNNGYSIPTKSKKRHSMTSTYSSSSMVNDAHDVLMFHDSSSPLSSSPLKSMMMMNVPSVIHTNNHHCWQQTLVTLDLSDNCLSELPSSINQLMALTTVILSMNQFTKFPKQLTKMKTLTSLHLKCNRITKLEESLFVPMSFKSLFSSKRNLNPICKTLKTLVLSHNTLQSFPESLSYFSVLQELDLSNNANIKNSIDEESFSFSWTNTLQMLNLDHCGLEKFPTLVTRLPNLRHIHCSNNNFKVLPKLGNLPYLSTLTVLSCEIEDLSPVFPQKMLRKLNASHNCIKNIPALSVHSVNVLEELLLSNNQLTSLGPELRAYTAIVTLDCGHNCITSVDSCISSLVNLKYLNLSHNQISEMPDDLFLPLTNLRSINLSHNKFLKKIPSLRSCTHLQKLSAKCCSLNQFPSGLEFIKSLLELDLSHNLLTSIDQSVYGCGLLEIFDISNNCIETMDVIKDAGTEAKVYDVSNLYSLRRLRIDGNSIPELPSAITKLRDVEQVKTSAQRALNGDQLHWIRTVGVSIINTFRAPHKVTDSLYIGSKDAVSNLGVLKNELGITHIVNLCSRKLGAQLNRFQVMSRYEVSEDLFIYLDMIDKCVDFIEQALQLQENKVLVICDDMSMLSPLILMSLDVVKSAKSADIQKLIERTQTLLPLAKMNVAKIEPVLRLFNESRHKEPMSPATPSITASPEVNLQSFAGLLSKKVPLIKTILTNDKNRMYFKQFCEQEKSLENVSFWEEIELRYKKIQDGLQRYGYARKIFETFIDTYEAPFQINIDQKLADEIESQLDAFSHLDPYLEDEEEDNNHGEKDRWRMSLVFPSHTFFDNLMLASERLMLDTVQRFQKSDLFVQMQTDHTAKTVETKFLIQTPPSAFRSLSGL